MNRPRFTARQAFALEQDAADANWAEAAEPVFDALQELAREQADGNEVEHAWQLYGFADGFAGTHDETQATDPSYGEHYRRGFDHGRRMTR